MYESTSSIIVLLDWYVAWVLAVYMFAAAMAIIFLMFHGDISVLESRTDSETPPRIGDASNLGTPKTTEQIAKLYSRKLEFKIGADIPYN